MATAFKQIATYTSTNSSIATVTFSSIPSSYKHLMLVLSAGSVTGGKELQMQINDDTSSNYSHIRMVADNSPSTSKNTSLSYARLGDIESDDSSKSIIHIPLYKDTNYRKKIILEQATFQRVTWFITHWHNTSAITKLKFMVEGSVLFRQHSTFGLYGIEG
jgi:hypothetical protein